MEPSEPQAGGGAPIRRDRPRRLAMPPGALEGLLRDHMDWLRRQFELARAGPTAHLPAMEGLRGLAVLLVFLVHYTTLVSPWIAQPSALMRIADALHTMGNAGVDLFFVLSGYLIYGSLIVRRQPFLAYLRRRITRIYPAFGTVLLLYLALSLAMPAESKIPTQAGPALRCVAENFLLLAAFTPHPPIITVSWSLSYEMFYYLAIPLLIAIFHLRRARRCWRVAFFMGTLLLSASYCAVFGGPLRLIMFVAGILLYEAQGHVPAPSGSVAACALLAGLGGLLLPVPLLPKMGLLFAAYFLLCLCCFSRPHGWLARAFSFTPLRWLGNISYSYYLLHGLVLKAGFAVLTHLSPPAPSGALFFWAGLAAMFVLTLPPCAALFLLIERPYSLARRAAPALAS